MNRNSGKKKSARLKNLFKGFIEKLDKKMKEKARVSCCCGASDKEKRSCCS